MFLKENGFYQFFFQNWARPSKARPTALSAPRRLPQPQAPIPRFFHLLQRSSFSAILRMSEPIILSDDEERIVLDTPLPTASKKRRTAPDPPVLILDDDPTPKKFSCDSTPSFVAETPYSEVAIVKCTSKAILPEEPLARVSADCPWFSGQCYARYRNV